MALSLVASLWACGAVALDEVDDAAFVQDGAVLIEPKGVVNTGDAGGEMTAANDVWV